MPGCRHRDECHIRRLPKQSKQLRKAVTVFDETGGLLLHSAGLYDGDEALFGGDINSTEPHRALAARRRASRASDLVVLLTLVHARTVHARTRATTWPRDFVRALNTDRGRQSHARGLTPRLVTPTRSRFPSAPIYTAPHPQRLVADNLSHRTLVGHSNPATSTNCGATP
jgi:hypothetical protein